MKIILFTLWILFVPLISIVIVIVYTLYFLTKKEVYKDWLDFYLDYFCIPIDIIFEK